MNRSAYAVNSGARSTESREEPDFSGCPHYGQGTGELNWTAVADDGTLGASGKTVEYEIRKSTASITDSNWGSAQAVVTHAPSVPGTVESLTVCCLGSGKWYFRMKTKDDNDRRSALSNQTVIDLSTYADCMGEGMYGGSGGSGGGGGSRARLTRNAANLASAWGGNFIENTLLDGAAAGTRAADLYRLGPAPLIANAAYQVRIRKAGSQTILLDAARLLVVDHSPEVTAHGLDGAVVLGGRAPAFHVTTAEGADLTASLDGSGEIFAPAGQALGVQLVDGADGAAPAGTLLLEAKTQVRALAPESAGIVIQEPDGSGGWRTVGQGYPRKEFDELAVGPLSGRELRLLFLNDCSIRFVGRLVPAAAEPTLHWASLLAASSTRLVDARSAIAAIDSVSATLADPDTLALGFSVPPLADGQIREFFLGVDATRLASRTEQPTLDRASQLEVPARFALHQNEPNPFRAKTTIRFDLPAGAMVRLEVFDVLGRRIERLASHWYPPGYHAVEWDQRDGGGKLVGPGLYFYRIEAGAMREQRKMLLLQ